MNDDDMCDKMDMEKLKVACGKINSKCYLCHNCRPQAGYDVPHCSAFSTEKTAYRLTDINIQSGISCAQFIDAESWRKAGELLAARLNLAKARKEVEKLEKRRSLV